MLGVDFVLLTFSYMKIDLLGAIFYVEKAYDDFLNLNNSNKINNPINKVYAV